MCVLVPVMFCSNPFLAAAGLATGALYYCIKNGAEARRGAWMLLVPIAGMIVNPLFVHNGMTILFFINNNAVTLEAALYGLNSGVMIAATLIWFTTFSQIMTSDKLLYVFGAVSPKLALILSMTLRYIPLYRKQIEKTNNAQKALGLYKDDNAIDKLKGSMRVFSVMVTWVLENGVITADSMTARGYGTGRRSRFAIFGWSRQDKLLIAVSLLLSLTVIAADLADALSYTWYPAVTAAAPGIFITAAYCAFTVLALIPDYLQIREETKWKYLMSEI